MGYVLFVLVAIAVVLGLYVKREIGASPSSEELQSFEHLPYFKNGKFHGPEEMKLYPDKVRNGPAGFGRMMFPSRFAPQKPLPI